MRNAHALLFGSLLVLGLVQTMVGPETALAQLDRYPPDLRFPKPDDEGLRLPNGKLQRDAILKHEHGKNLDELKEIHELSGELIEELEEDTEFVLSLKSLKKLERIEKLSKDVRKRIKK